MRQLFLLLISAFVTINSLAQTGAAITVFGTAKEVVTGEVITELSVVAVDVEDPSRTIQGRSLNNGKYDLELNDVATYRLTYSAPGFVSKSVEIAMEGPSEEDLKKGYGMQIDITLLQHFEDIDYSILDQPFGRSAYNASIGSYEWETEYTSSLKEGQSRLMEDYKKKMSEK